jgi:NitT/TauT family transport system permease protein
VIVPRRPGRVLRGRIVPPVIVFVAACLILELCVRAFRVPPYMLPRPTAVVRTLVSDIKPMGAAVRSTFEAALAGFAASTVFGVLAAAVLSSSLLVRRALYPYTVVFQTVPIIAIAPLLILWFEAGFQAVAICAFVVSVFPVITNTLTGLLSADPALVDLFRLYGARRRDAMLKLRLPAALPSLFAGLRVAAGLAVIGTVVAELLVGEIGEGEGLGVIIASGAKYGRTDRVFAAVLLTSLLGLALFGAVNLVGHLLLRRWHASEKE